MVTSTSMSAEELFGYEVAGKRTELVRGKLVVREPAGLRHGTIGMRIGHLLLAHLERERLEQGAPHSRGIVFGADTGFIIARAPDTVRAPDVAFVLAERLPGPIVAGFGDLAPDLAVEVRSRSDRAGEVIAKVGDWLSAGTQLVWEVDPLRSQVIVYLADDSVTVLGLSDALSGDALLPGFVLPLTEVFTAM